MRRKILAILLSVILCLPVISACSCNKLQKLSFSNYFYNGYESSINTPPCGYKETLSYKVDFNTDSSYYKLSETVSNLLTTPTFSDGELKTVLEIVPDIDDEIKNKTNFIKSDTNIYNFTYDFSIKSIYEINGEKFENEEYIESTVYFYPASSSFAPIYSLTKSYNSALNFDGKTFNLQFIESKKEIIYNSDTYTTNSSATLFNQNKEKLSENSNGKTFDYLTETVIDNSQLLFALRNINYDSANAFSLPTVDASYGKYTKLIANESEDSNTEKNISLTYNGDLKDVKFKLKNIGYRVDENKATGMMQYVSIQKESTELPTLALPVIYYRPVVTSSNPATLGTLIFTLTSIEIVK
ncbi:MAG: hypothetical protein MJ066_03465 [Clostridia bacterium]|nr:hypothetical protein [Clostridia bacterium]